LSYGHVMANVRVIRESLPMHILLSLALLAATSEPTSQPASSRKTWLWASGLTIAAVAYVSLGTVTSILCADDKPAPCQAYVVPSSWVPVAGPWIILSSASPGQMVPLIIGGVAEFAGIVMLIVGLTLKEEVKVPIVMPMLGNDRAGLQLSYRF
jgi:hypothetical protein